MGYIGRVFGQPDQGGYCKDSELPHGVKNVRQLC
jgi:hypothetical protein